MNKNLNKNASLLLQPTSSVTLGKSPGGESCLIALSVKTLHFLQIEGKAPHQQKDYDLLYCGGLEQNPQYLRGMSVLDQTKPSGNKVTLWGGRLHGRVPFTLFPFLSLHTGSRLPNEMLVIGHQGCEEKEENGPAKIHHHP